MASAPIYKTKGNKDMEREGAGGKSDKPEKKESAAEEKGGEPKKAESAEHPHKAHHDRHSTEREAMNKKHEAERRDHHNNHREAMRMMHTRHQKDHAEMNTRHMADLADQGAGVTEGQQPMAQQAQGGGVQSAAAA